MDPITLDRTALEDLIDSLYEASGDETYFPAALGRVLLSGFAVELQGMIEESLEIEVEQAQ